MAIGWLSACDDLSSTLEPLVWAGRVNSRSRILGIPSKLRESYEQRHGSKKADEEETGEDLRREARSEAGEAAGQRTLTDGHVCCGGLTSRRSSVSLTGPAIPVYTLARAERTTRRQKRAS